MSVDVAASQGAENGNDGKTRRSCPLYGCKRVYTDTEALEAHVKDHGLQAESLPGKVMLCSTLGCSGSFPNMQKLMEHMRHHHKPNIFFLCESCRAKLRSFRGLLTHLHTCSKVPRKTKSTEQPPATSNQSMLPMATEQDAPQQQQQQEGAGLQQTSSAGGPVSWQDSAPLGHQGASQARPHDEASAQSSSLSLDSLTEQQPQGASPIHAGSGSGPHSPPGATAVWRKSQGAPGSRRILWEHTKGNYRCVQCGQSASNRREMTQHISSHHSTAKPPEDAASDAQL
ncbi:zinc finger protein 414 [Genypterus blacodes]|uniref:zinc finger protein 414 n=1 Tax=Genypterus blacodes TaxID=154954 RepID=UPI003F76C534